MNNATKLFRLVGYVASNAVFILLVGIGKEAIPAVPFAVAIAVVLCTVTVSDKPR